MHHAAGWSQVLAAALDDAWKRVWSPLERGSEFKHGLGGKKKTGQKGKVCGYLHVGPLSCTCAELLARFEMKVTRCMREQRGSHLFNYTLFEGLAEGSADPGHLAPFPLAIFPHVSTVTWSQSRGNAT